MPLNTDELQFISFSSQFNYLHVVSSGVVTGTNISIPLPAGLTNPFFRAYIQEGTEIIPIAGYFCTASEAYILNGNLVLKSYGGTNGVLVKTFYYFIYGGNYE